VAVKAASALIPMAAALLVLATAGLVALLLRDDERPAGRASAVVTAAPSPTPPPPALPEPDARLPSGPRALAGELGSTRRQLHSAIDRWRSEGAPASGGAPEDVELLAIRQQRIYRLLGGARRLSRRVIAALPADLRAEARDNVLARRELGQIESVRRGPPPKIAIGAAQPADMLRRHYRRAWRRFEVGPPLLAAVNFVESAFGRLRNRSISGARGPMQFMPATWAAYGLGGDVRDPRDAILGAANYLHANGAPADETRALFRYNPSAAYVAAISRYARRIRADWRAYYAYYAWAVYIGDHRRTGPGT
jgi:soluble lytic murein transglycosylase-like protein